MMQPSFDTLDGESIESIDGFSLENERFAMFIDYEPMLARHENGISYNLGLRLAIKDMPDEPARVPYRITCEGRRVFTSIGWRRLPSEATACYHAISMSFGC